MTDNEIIKALEYCKEQGITSECEKCNIKEDCRRELIAITIDLINRQQAEIERLKAKIEGEAIDIKDLEKEIALAKECGLSGKNAFNAAMSVCIYEAERKGGVDNA